MCEKIYSILWRFAFDSRELLTDTRPQENAMKSIICRFDIMYIIIDVL